MSTRSAMVVEDNEALSRVLARAMERWGFACRTARTLREAESELERGGVDLVLLDVGLPDGSGLDLLGYLRLNAPAADAIVMTGAEDMMLAARAMSEGAIEFLAKPFETDELGAIVRRWLAQGGTPEPPRAPRGRDLSPPQQPGPTRPPIDLPALIGRHPSMIGLFKRAGLASTGREPVLIRGETGTGKELLARTIHRLAHADRPFVTLDCTALPDHLLEVELFGNAPGAASVRPGRLALAGSGTLFVEEVGELSLDVQVRLREGLHEGVFGASEERPGTPLRARLVTSTRQNLDARVDEGAFDPELLQQIRRFELVIPPLRHRVIDIPDLARDIARRAAERRGLADPPPFTATAFDALRAHPWPGNIRELEQAVRKAVARWDTEPIGPGDLGLALAPGRAIPVDATLDEVVFTHARNVLDDCDGNKREAARRLDISPGRLYRILEQD